MKLSKNLSLGEVTKSNTATRLGIDNTPNEKIIANLKQTAECIFQPIREYFECPIYISSGYRSPGLNRAIGGSETSEHCFGFALDLDQDNRNTPITNAMVFNMIKNYLEFNQLIWEFGDDNNPDWVHVSYQKGNNKNKVLRAVRVDGKTSYLPFE